MIKALKLFLLLFFVVVFNNLVLAQDEPRAIPVFSQRAKLIAPDGQEDDNFGSSTAISADGEIAVVSSRNDQLGTENYQGSVYVFMRQKTLWVLQQKLFAADGAFADYFGSSIAISADGSIILVGATNAGSLNEGAVYVFKRSGTSWVQQQKLVPPNGASGDSFGGTVAINAAGTTALIGAKYDDAPATDRGSAYVFTRNGSTWSFQQQLNATDGVTSDYFGSSTALSRDGNMAIIGAPNSNTGAADRGSAYVFVRSAGVWTQQQVLAPPTNQAGAFFGNAVTLSEDSNTALIGAYMYDVNIGGDNQGAAFVFTRSGTTWTYQDDMTAGGDTGLFGASVELSDDGNMAYIGATGVTSLYVSEGRVYTFSRTGTSWSPHQTLRLLDYTEYVYFGTDVAASGDGKTLIATTTNVDAGRGAAYLYSSGSQQLLTNTGFERDANRNFQPDQWAIAGITQDRLMCGKASYLYTGNCGYRFKGGAGENSSLSQGVSGIIFSAGDQLDLAFYYKAATKPNLQVKISIYYADKFVGTRSATIADPSPGYSLYTLLPYVLDDRATVTKLKVQFTNRATAGVLYLDNINFHYTAAQLRSNEGFFPLPPAP